MFTSPLESLDFISSKNPAYYKYYPTLFSNYFNYENREILDNLSKAGYLYYQSILFTDLVLDDKNFSAFPNISICQEESIKILTSIFGVNKPFWQYWSKRKLEYYEAFKTEKSLNLNKNLSLYKYIDLADKKSAFGKIAIDSLYCLNNEKDKKMYELLLESHKYFSVGFQLYDDVQDFLEDFHKKQFNWAFNQLHNILDENEKKLTINIQHKLLYFKGIAQQILKLAIQYFKKSLHILEPFQKNSLWKKTVLDTIQKVKNYIDIIDGYIKTLYARNNIKNAIIPKQPFFLYEKVKNKIILNGLNFINKNYNENYAELKHIMFLSKSEGFNNKNEIHTTDIFQRAMLDDCLLDITKKYQLDTQKFIQEELNYLLSKRQKDKIGVWSYFDTVKEIAADIDDLGQIIQLFIKSDNTHLINQYCLNAVDTIMKDRTVPSGGIETWIIPKNNQTLLQKKQEKFNTLKWGKGPDVEVVANFILSLHQFDKIKFNLTINNAIKYILSIQNKNGYWESRWYIGHYYGTYICLKLLTQFKQKYKTNINKVSKHLINTQNADGGFGINNNSDSLNTAFALITLKMIKNEKLDLSIKKATQYLYKNQQKDGSWEGINFIKPKLGESYKSATLTTGYVLKSLVL